MSRCTLVCNVLHCTPVCKHGAMAPDSSRARSTAETRDRILDVALEVLGANPDAGMGEIATAAGVVRRTVYGHFPSRVELIRTLTGRAVTEMTAVLADVDAADADAAWAEFVSRLWPVVNRYRVLVALRRGEYGEAIHALLGPIDERLADLVQRGQDAGVFARYLPANLLSQVAYGAVFAIADGDTARGDTAGDGAAAAAITSLLMVGVPEARAIALVDGIGAVT